MPGAKRPSETGSKICNAQTNACVLASNPLLPCRANLVYIWIVYAHKLLGDTLSCPSQARSSLPTFSVLFIPQDAPSIVEGGTKTGRERLSMQLQGCLRTGLAVIEMKQRHPVANQKDQVQARFVQGTAQWQGATI